MNPLFKDGFSVLWPILVVVGGYILATRKDADKVQGDTKVIRKELDGILKEFKEFATANQGVILNHTVTLNLMTKTLDSIVTKLEALDKRISALEVDITVMKLIKDKKHA